MKPTIIGIGVVIVVIALIFGAYGELAGLGGWTDGGTEGAHNFIGRVTLSDTTYATSWKSNEESEQITASVDFQFSGVSLHHLNKYYYTAYVSGQETARYPSSGYIEYPDYGQGHPEGVWFNLDPWIFTIMGESVGKLKVQMVAYLDGTWPYGDWEGNAGWDGAYLESGKGEIFIEGSQEVFEEGQSAPVFIKTGFTGGAGWTVFLYPPTDRSDLQTQTIGSYEDNIQKVIDIPIEAGWFKVGSSNEYRVELWNHLFDVGFTQIFTVDLLERAPGQVEYSNEAWEGNDATLTVTSTSTYRPIDKFIVWVWYGDQTMPSISDGESWIQYGYQYPATISQGLNYTATFSFQAKNKDGNVMVKTVARDDEGRSSNPAYYQLVVENGNFDDGGNWVERNFQITIWVILGIVAMIGGTLGIWYFIRGKVEKKAFIIIIFNAIMVVLVYVAGMGGI